MSGKVFVAHTGDPQSDHELPTKQYMDAAYDRVNQLDGRHEALSTNHSATRTALQQLISNVHSPATTLAAGANTFVPKGSKLDQYKTTTDTIETALSMLATKEELLPYVKSSELQTALQTARTPCSNLSPPGGIINGQAFTGQETITIDAVSSTTFHTTVASLATKEDIQTHGVVTPTDLRSMKADTATNISPGGSIYGQPFTGRETITAQSLTPQGHLSGNAYNGDAAYVWSVNATETADNGTVPVRTPIGDIRAAKFIGDLQGQADSAVNALKLGGQDASVFVTHPQFETALASVPKQEAGTLLAARPSPPWQTGQIILSSAGLEVYDGTFWRIISLPTIRWPGWTAGGEGAIVLHENYLHIIAANAYALAPSMQQNLMDQTVLLKYTVDSTGLSYDTSGPSHANVLGYQWGLGKDQFFSLNMGTHNGGSGAVTVPLYLVVWDGTHNTPYAHAYIAVENGGEGTGFAYEFLHTTKHTVTLGFSINTAGKTFSYRIRCIDESGTPLANFERTNVPFQRDNDAVLDEASARSVTRGLCLGGGLEIHNMGTSGSSGTENVVFHGLHIAPNILSSDQFDENFVTRAASNGPMTLVGCDLNHPMGA